MRRQRCLILMADTGGGHRAAARAILEGLDAGFPGRFEVIVSDPLAAAAWPIGGFGRGYGPLVQHLPALYGAAWHRSDGMRAAAALHAALRPGLDPVLRRIYAETRPELVLSVHPMLTRRAQRVLRASGSQAPFAVAVTDLFDAHAMWFEPEADFCSLPTEGAATLARQRGMPADRLRVLGQPIRPCFATPGPDPAELRASLGLDPRRATLLLTGGGDGLGRMQELAGAIASCGRPMQLVVIAGRNQGLVERLTRERWPSGVSVVVRGFVDNMVDWMRAADMIVTKAGPGTIMEALAAGLPILLHGYLPGQEEGNLRYLTENALGHYAERPEAIAEQVAHWLAPEHAEALAAWRRRALAAARPAAALEIATALAGLLEPASA